MCRAPPFCVGERSAAPVIHTESTGAVDVSVVLLNKCDYVKLLFIYYLHTNAINIALTKKKLIILKKTLRLLKPGIVVFRVLQSDAFVSKCNSLALLS